MPVTPGASIEAVLSSPTYAAMRAYRRWLPYRLIPREGKKPNKVPYSLAGHECNAHDSANHFTADVAANAARLLGPDFGLAFDFVRADGFWFVDVDHAAANGVWNPIATELCAKLAGAAVEVSISGDGLHLFGRGVVPDHRTSNPRLHIELYDNERFCAMTATGAIGDSGVSFDISPIVGTYFAPDVARVHGPIKDNDWNAKTEKQREETLFDLVSALAVLDSDDEGAWSAVGQNLRGLEEIGYQLWAAWSATSKRFPGGDGLERWERFRGNRSDYRSIFAKAEKLGWANPRRKVYAFGQQAPAGVVPPVPDTPPVAAVAVSEYADDPKVKQYEATIQQVEHTLRLKRIVGTDEFLGRIMISSDSQVWRPLEDVDYARLRSAFGKGGFKPIRSDVMRDAVLIVSKENIFDSAIQWANSLVWDGTPRIATAMCDYFSCEDSDYSRAVSRYLFTALAGRALVPGIQADMVPILIGMQGTGKTSAVRALAPFKAAFAQIDLKDKDADLARLTKGKLVVELPELQGLSGRARESIKHWVTAHGSEHVKKFSEDPVALDRRFIAVGTSNPKDVLDDDTGERRWLPIECGLVLLDALIRDCEQLWAEGVALFKLSGIAWREAQELAKLEHGKFKKTDEAWMRIIENWCEKNSDPFFTDDVLYDVLKFSVRDAGKEDAARIAKILKNLGFEKKQTWWKGKNERMWRK